MRAISELVSAALLALIAITVGGLVVSLLVNSLAQQRSQLQDELVKQLYGSRQAIGIVLAYVAPDGYIHIVAATGDTPSTINAVYVNGEKADCTLKLTNGTAISYGAGIPPYTSVVAECSPVGSPPYIVRLVYPGGSAVALAR